MDAQEKPHAKNNLERGRFSLIEGFTGAATQLPPEIKEI